MSFVSLHNHSGYSILDSTCSVQNMVKKAKESGIDTLALTDNSAMYGHVEFYKEALHVGIKPILGVTLRVSLQDCTEKNRDNPSYPIILLIKDEIGYQNLSKLSSMAHTEGFYYYPRIDKKILEKYKDGIICLSGGRNSYIADLINKDKEEEALLEILWYKNLFQEDFYFEIQRQAKKIESDEAWVEQKSEKYLEFENKVNKRLIELSKQLDVKYVATQETHYLEKEDVKSHEVLVNIQKGEPVEIWERDSSGIAKWTKPNPKRRIYPSNEFYFKTSEEINSIFSDIKEAIENTKEIADKCNFEFNFKKKHYPVFIPPGFEGEKLSKKNRLEEVSNYLYTICVENIEDRYPNHILEKIKNKFPNRKPLEIVQERLEYEFKLISSKHLCDYLLIVNDFISWAKKNKIPVGPGRGSVVGSIVAYLMGITNIEPLMFDLVFERFINPERVSYPDIDVDICMERRQEVIDYTISKYGKENVAQIITFGTMKAKMAIRDVGRMLSVELSKVDSIAKLIPEEIGMTLEKALKIDTELLRLYQNDKDAKRIIDIGKKVEGSIRNTSIHAAGIIISEGPVTDYVPACLAKDVNMLVTQFAMKPVEALGMLKIDFLGLKTLTAIQKALEDIKQTEGKEIDLETLDLDDKKTYDLLTKGHTLGVFQLESGGMQALVKKLKIDKFEEIIAVGALYRPGPMDMIPSFIARKHKQEKIEIDHPLMENILSETYGVMVYQEQVMQIASTLAGYSLGEGDFLRKAMGKKDRKEMEKQREKFISGCISKKIEESVAIKIFNKIEKFASYGFNKSHATAYAYISYVTAFLKAHYPKQWMAALMSCDRDDLSKIAKFIQETKAMQIDILSPDVNESGSFFISSKKGIRFAMTGIKGIGHGVVKAIVEGRAEAPYESLYDFIKKVDKKRVGKKAIETLIDAGAFDSIDLDRDSLKSNVQMMYERALKEQREKEKGVMDFLSLIGEEKVVFPKKEEIKKSTKLEILQKEKELLGFYLTDHPLTSYGHLLKKLSCVSLSSFLDIKESSFFRVLFIIESVKIKIASKSQRKFAILKISDGIENFELPVWPELFEKKHHILKDNQLIYAVLQVEKNENGVKLQCHFLEDLTKIDESSIKNCDDVYDKAKIKYAGRVWKNVTKKPKEEKKISIHVDVDKIHFSTILEIKKKFLECGGDYSVNIDFNIDNKNLGSLSLDSTNVSYDKLVKKLENIVGIEKIELLS